MDYIERGISCPERLEVFGFSLSNSDAGPDLTIRGNYLGLDIHDSQESNNLYREHTSKWIPFKFLNLLLFQILDPYQSYPNFILYSLPPDLRFRWQARFKMNWSVWLIHQLIQSPARLHTQKHCCCWIAQRQTGSIMIR